MAELSVGVAIKGRDALGPVIDKATSRTLSKFQALEKKLGKGGGMNMAVMTGGIVAAGMAFNRAFAPAMAFEEAMALVKSVAPGTFGSVDADMQRISDSARGWAKSHGDTAETFARASYQMLSAGLNTEQAIAATETALLVSKGTMGDATVVAEFLATAYNTLGNKGAAVAGEMQRVGDVLVKTQQYYQLPDMARLTDGMTYAIPVAVQFGMSLESAAASVGQLNSLGLKGSLAGTAFASSMAQMNKASKDLKFSIARTADGGVDFVGTIDNIRDKFGDKMGMPKVQEQFKKAFGMEGMRAIALLVAKADDLKTGYDKVSNATGAMSAAATTMSNTTNSKIAVMKNGLDELSIKFGAVALPLVNDALPKVNAAFDGISEHYELVLAGMAVLTSAFLYKTVVPMVISAATYLMANPAIAGLAAVAAGAAYAAEYVEGSQKKASRKRMAEGNSLGVFEGVGGAAAAAAAAKASMGPGYVPDASYAPGYYPTAPEGPVFGASPATTPSLTAAIENLTTGGMIRSEVGGVISIAFDNAPAGMRVAEVSATNPSVSLAVKGNTGKNNVGTGKL